MKTPTIKSCLTYLSPTDSRPYNYMYEPTNGSPRENCVYEQHEVEISDARMMVQRPSIHNEGFELWEAPSALKDFEEEESIARIYYGEVRELACAAAGGKEAYVFDHLVRRREPGQAIVGFGRRGDGSQPAAVGRVHNDYSEASGRSRLHQVLHEKAKKVQRYSIINIWRSISGPILDAPLAVCDARTISSTDLVAAEIRYPNRTGEIYLVTHSPLHRWSYYSAQDKHEALIFKQYDSLVNGCARFTPHASFDHPHTPPSAPLRQSIEARVLVVFE